MKFGLLKKRIFVCLTLTTVISYKNRSNLYYADNATSNTSTATLIYSSASIHSVDTTMIALQSSCLGVFCVPLYQGFYWCAKYSLCYSTSYLFAIHYLNLNQVNIRHFIVEDTSWMASTNTISATALAEQNPEDIYEQYEKYLNAGR